MKKPKNNPVYGESTTDDIWFLKENISDKIIKAKGKFVSGDFLSVAQKPKKSDEQTPILNHDGLCPNPECRKDVPHGCYYCSRKCARRCNYLLHKHGGNTAPVHTGRTRLEKKSTRALWMGG